MAKFRQLTRQQVQNENPDLPSWLVDNMFKIRQQTGGATPSAPHYDQQGNPNVKIQRPELNHGGTVDYAYGGVPNYVVSSNAVPVQGSFVSNQPANNPDGS